MKLFARLVQFQLLATLVFVALVGAGVAPARDQVKKNTKYPQQVLIVRHAEKTGEKGDIHLSKQGQERAAELDRLFERSRERPEPFPTPDFIFAAADDKTSHRPVETVTPLAKKLQLSINDAFESKLPAALNPTGNPEKTAKGPGMLGLRDELFSTPKYFGKTILVSWRHGTIPELAKTLKATKAPAKWVDEVFDRVWQIDYDDDGNAVFNDRPQRLMMGDAEK